MSKTFAVLLGVFVMTVAGCAALFGEPGFMEPAVIDPATGEVVMPAVERPATPGLLTTIGQGVGGPVGAIIGLIGAFGAAVQSWRLRKRVPASMIVQAVDVAQHATGSLNAVSPGQPSRTDLGDLIGSALRTLSASAAAKIEAAFRADRAGKA